MEKIFIVFSERTQYNGNKVISVDEQMWPNFFITDKDADAQIEKIINNICSIGSDNHKGRHIVISGNIQYRFRIAELRKA